LGGSGTGLVPPLTFITTVAKISSSRFTRLELINLNFYF